MCLRTATDEHRHVCTARQVCCAYLRYQHELQFLRTFAPFTPFQPCCWDWRVTSQALVQASIIELLVNANFATIQG
jgi:hypothetical protein